MASCVTQALPHLKFGSPFDHDPQHSHDVEIVHANIPPGTSDDTTPEGHPVVLWEGLSEHDVSALDQEKHEHLHDHDCPGDNVAAARRFSCAMRLGKVTFYVRGEGDTTYSHRTAVLTDECLLIPAPELSSSPIDSIMLHGPESDEADDGEPAPQSCEPMTIQKWLSHVRSESSRKMPLPKQWFALPSEELRQLAEERGFMGDDADKRIVLVKFLRDYEKSRSIK